MRTATTTTTVFVAVSTSQATAGSLTPAPAASAEVGQKSPWHSPVPYLFGGLAAMLGLIAFALLILACSYWRLTDREERRRRDLESGEKDESAGKAPAIYEEKILVIMAGDENPTFLATPVCAKFVAFAGGEEKIGDGCESNSDRDTSDENGKVKKEVTVIAVDSDGHAREYESEQDQENQ